MKEEKNVIWDLGGPIVHFELDFMYEALAKLFGVPIKDMLSFWIDEGHPPIWHQFDMGLSEETIHTLFTNRFKKQVLKEDFHHAFNVAPRIRLQEGFLELSQELYEAGIRQILFSNINYLHGNYVRSMFPDIFRHIHHGDCLFSCEIGVRKSESPDPFLHIAKRCNIDLSRSWIVEDRLQNIIGMQKAGGKGILFIPQEGFHRLRYHFLREGILSS